MECFNGLDNLQLNKRSTMFFARSNWNEIKECENLTNLRQIRDRQNREVRRTNSTNNEKFRKKLQKNRWRKKFSWIGNSLSFRFLFFTENDDQNSRKHQIRDRFHSQFELKSFLYRDSMKNQTKIKDGICPTVEHNKSNVQKFWTIKNANKTFLIWLIDHRMKEDAFGSPEFSFCSSRFFPRKAKRSDEKIILQKNKIFVHDSGDECKWSWKVLSLRCVDWSKTKVHFYIRPSFSKCYTQSSLRSLVLISIPNIL